MKSFRGKYLTPTAATVAKISDAKIEKKDIKAAEIRELGFPAEYIQECQLCYFCERCTHPGLSQDNFVLFNHCGSKSLKARCPQHFRVRLAFENENGEIISINMPHDLVVKFAEAQNLDIQNVSSIEEKFLSDTITRFTFDASSRIMLKLVD